MSSYKNAHKSYQKIHRERAQPNARKKFGLLQKHKDYVLRAKNYHRKQDLLKILREKAQNRNPDEFYFRMISQKTVDGQHIIDTDEKLSKDEVKLLRSQDLNYINFKLAGEKKKIERLRGEVQLIGKNTGEKRENTHIIFVGNKKELLKYENMADQKNNTKQSDQDQVDEMDHGEDNSMLQPPIHNPVKDSKLSRELKQRKLRANTLNKLARKMEIDKAIKKEKPIITRKNDGGVVYKWKKERKK
ncbi:U3 small nucleolar RNA-associated protein 11 [Oopsacas minuta]|uniref:U3 small nucleolar RNA-associated protein 11 n=1 Tax=Oopsacas minuta TaxID=111878 RepID=A0AAV7KBF8_9METZ|nr:U3 small nucleolar RNA-associated protein 11 [Oopsacas minuta]